MPKIRSPKASPKTESAPMQNLLETIANAIAGSMEKIETVLGVLGAAVLGRLMFHADQVKRGKRHFWSRELVMDLIIACSMGLIAYGFCIWAKIDGPPQAAMIAALGYLGPHTIDAYYAARAAQISAANNAPKDEV